jgi:nitrogen fixation/metabolism regulation signal transduction histidine kinase
MRENKTMITFNKTYFGFALLLFSIEVVIAFFVDDNIVRPYLGDVFVVILIYCFF